MVIGALHITSMVTDEPTHNKEVTHGDTGEQKKGKEGDGPEEREREKVGSNPVPKTMGSVWVLINLGPLPFLPLSKLTIVF